MSKKKPGQFPKQKIDSCMDNDELIRKFCKMECDICTQPLDTHSEALDHFHNKNNGYLICCNKKYFKYSILKQHCVWHLDPEAFK